MADTLCHIEVGKHSDAMPCRADHLRVRELDGEAVVYDDAGAIIYRLNTTAYFIWRQCDGTRDFRMISDQLVATYDVEVDTASADTSRMLTDLYRVGLLERSLAGGGV